jgi:hypothetical protein
MGATVIHLSSLARIPTLGQVSPVVGSLVSRYSNFPAVREGADLVGVARDPGVGSPGLWYYRPPTRPTERRHRCFTDPRVGGVRWFSTAIFSGILRALGLLCREK